MRRIRTNETLHGTRDGQLAIDETLAQRFGLTERESTCAALLKLGKSTQEIADRLDVAPSTAEKHLVALRKKLSVSTTIEAVVSLYREETESTSRIPDAFGVVLPVSDPTSNGSSATVAPGTSDLVASLRDASTLEDMLLLVRDDLREEGVEALFYSFLPMAAASFRKGDLLQRHCASKTLLDALREDRGVSLTAIGTRLFAEPDRDVVIALDAPSDPGLSPAVEEACRRTGLSTCIALGSPFGTGYVVLAAFTRDASGSATTVRLRRDLRDRLLLLQNVAYSFGALARSAGLTTRERDTLASVAAGHSMREIASMSSSSERAVGQLLSSAREKLRAATTAEAVAKAMALNALVFL